ncbi:MAG: aminotransferase class III-fold pyridoxal phosphate-dependent enzyme [Pseudomonadales bacterium]|nr:aminotransferase class III-fold pyridoxal phosphate-dependent enzyme [Pseudomonadales bacterium]
MLTLATAQAELLAKTKASQEIASDRAEVLNSGLAANLEMPHPVFIDRGEGPYVYDADDNRYIDTSVGFGLHMLGHVHPVVEQAIQARVPKGWMFGIHSTSQLKLANLVQEGSPCAERVVFCNTGSEATMYAFRAARGYSGRDKIALFDGFYHGAHDYGMWVADPASPRTTPSALPMGHGIPGVLKELTLLLPYRDSHAFDLIRQHKDELALVFVEGVQSSNPQPEVGEFLRELEAVCRASGVLFGVDEVITGFRVAYGGAQERFSINPDLATYGKVIGGGLPVGAITGRAEVMDVFTGLAADRGVFSGGTFSGNPLTMEAGAAVLKHLRDHPEIYVELERRTQRLADAVNAHCESLQLPVQMKHVGSMFHMFFQRETIMSSRDIHGRELSAQKAFYLHCLNAGVLVPGTQRAFLSAAHDDQVVDELIEVFTASFDAVNTEGLFSSAQ